MVQAQSALRLDKGRGAQRAAPLAFALVIQVIEDSGRTTPHNNQAQLPLVGQPLDARVPLSLLEAVRSMDTPDSELDAELVHELRNKRFGLSETVNAQIRRYNEMVRKSHRVNYDEVLALSRLIGRRPDADLVFREAGRRLARSALSTLSTTTRKAAIALPALVGRPIALRQLRRVSRTFLDGKLQRQGSAIVLEVVAPVSADAAPRSAGCGLYEAALRESLQTLAGADGLVEHVACRARGDASCQWRTDWRKR
jgi:predicted hydrocarbon binding protein